MKKNIAFKNIICFLFFVLVCVFYKTICFSKPNDMSMLYKQEYHDMLYDDIFCLKNNIDCRFILYRILCGDNEYYIADVTKNDNGNGKQNFNLLDNDYKPIFDFYFYSQYVKTMAESDRYWNVVLGDIEGSFLDRNKTLYLKQHILNFENDDEIIEYDLFNKKILKRNKKKYNKNVKFNDDIKIVDTIDLSDGRLCLVSNGENNAVLDENGKIIIGYYEYIKIDNYLSIIGHENEFSIYDVIFHVVENNKTKYLTTIKNEKINSDKYVYYLGDGFYCNGFDYEKEEIGNDNIIYNLHSETKILTKISGRYLEMFKFRDNVYFYYYAPIYDKPNGYMSIYDKNGSEIDISKKIKFKNLKTKNGLEIKENLKTVNDEYIFGFTDKKIFVIDSHMNIVKEINGSFQTINCYGEGKYCIYVLYTNNNKKDSDVYFYDAKFNIICEKILGNGIVTTENILNKKKNKHYLGISYALDDSNSEIYEYIYVFDWFRNKYIISKDKNLILYDYCLKLNNEIGNLYFRLNHINGNYDIYNQKGKKIFDNVIFYNKNLFLSKEIGVGLPKNFLVIYDGKTTKFLDLNLSIVKEFYEKLNILFVSPTVNYYNDFYDVLGDKKFYLRLIGENNEMLIDNELNILTKNKEDTNEYLENLYDE